MSHMTMYECHSSHHTAGLASGSYRLWMWSKCCTYHSLSIWSIKHCHYFTQFCTWCKGNRKSDLVHLLKTEKHELTACTGDLHYSKIISTFFAFLSLQTLTASRDFNLSGTSLWKDLTNVIWFSCCFLEIWFWFFIMLQQLNVY